jgi:DNA-binding NarL/FixJ family response regulator
MKTILQVDDDANDIFMLQHAMKKVGVTNPIQVATDGQEAIDYLQGVGKFADRERFPFPCLLLMDLKLPYVMGLNVLRWIRTQPGPPLIVVMLTASAEDADIAEAYRLGANAFLTKPSEASKLEDMVKAIMAFWLTYNTLPPQSLLESHDRVVPSLIHSRAAPLTEAILPAANGAIREVGNGNRLFNVPIAKPLLKQPQNGDLQPKSTAGPRLTRRQTEVVRLIADGYSNRQIARLLRVSIKTVQKHCQSLMDKLDIHEVATLTRYAVSSGLVESKPYAQLAGHAHSHARKTLRHATRRGRECPKRG